MLSSWYETGSRIVNRHTGRAFRCRPKSFVETQVERLGPEGTRVLLDDARESAQEARDAIGVILGCLSDGREWNACDLRMATTCSTGALYLALEALTVTSVIYGPAPYEHEPTGDMSELVYSLPARDLECDEYHNQERRMRLIETGELDRDPPWDDGGEEFPF